MALPPHFARRVCASVALGWLACVFLRVAGFVGWPYLYVLSPVVLLGAVAAAAVTLLLLTWLWFFAGAKGAEWRERRRQSHLRNAFDRGLFRLVEDDHQRARRHGKDWR